MRLIITRHGETIENKKGVLQGHLHGTLSELGIEQARKVAERLRNEKIDFIYSSDLARAADTSKEIAKYHNVPLYFTEDLRERNLGILQGKIKEEVMKKLGNNFKKTYQKPKSGENFEQLIFRARRFFDKIRLKHEKDEVLLVGHNQINKSLISIIKTEPYSEISNLNNTSICIYELNGTEYKELLFNCTKHLR